MPLVQLTYADIKVGAQLRWPVYDQGRRLLYKKGATIQNENQLKLLLRLGLYRVENEAEDDLNRINREVNPFTSIAELRLWVENTFKYALAGNTDDQDVVTRVHKIVSKLILMTEEDTDATLGAIHLDHDGNYSQVHALHSALLAYLIARALDYEPDRVISLMSAALTANIGMVDIQDILRFQKKPPSDEQRKTIDDHPRRGAEILQNAGVKDKLWLNIVYQHHEKNNGEGYPRKLPGERILQESKIVSLADRYHALINQRSDRDAQSPTEVLKGLFLEQGKEIDEDLAQLFIKTLGIYPPGTVVSLANGETAIVTRRSLDKMKPFVRAITNAKKQPYSRPLLRNTEDEEYKLIGLAQMENIPMFALMRLWEYE